MLIACHGGAFTKEEVSHVSVFHAIAVVLSKAHFLSPLTIRHECEKKIKKITTKDYISLYNNDALIIVIFFIVMINIVRRFALHGSQNVIGLVLSYLFIL